MAEQNYRIEDIVDYSMQDNPTKVMDAFNSIISPKVLDGLATMKQNVAKQYLNHPAFEESTEEELGDTE